MTITNTSTSKTTNTERTKATVIAGRITRVLTIPALVLAGSLATVSMLAAPASANPCNHDPIFAEANGCREMPAASVSRRVTNTVKAHVPSNVR